MSEKVPTWLTEEFIKDVLNGDIKSTSEIKVCNLEIDTPIAKGNNFMCDIYRAKVQYIDPYRTKEASLIIKSPIPGSRSYQLTVPGGVMQKEIRIYREYIPKLNSLMPETGWLTPKSYHTTEKNVLVLENLNYLGYTMVERLHLLDYDHSVLAIKGLARYHAGSVKLHDDDPEFVEEIGRELFYTDGGVTTDIGIVRFFKTGFILLAEILKEHPIGKKYSHKLHQYSDDLWSILLEKLSTKNGEFCVLNHGDFWLTNMMFRYDSNEKPISIKLIDLQGNMYTTPAFDLYYFLYNSVREDIRINKSDNLVDIYLGEINRNLESFGRPRRLDRLQLRKQLKEREVFGLYASVALFPLFIVDPAVSKNVSIDKCLAEEDPMKNPMKIFYENKKYIEIILKRLEEFEKSGLF